MAGTVLRLVWFAVIASGISFGVYLYAGSIVHASEAGKYDAVAVRDVIGPGVHHLSGMIMVPSSCDQLIVDTASEDASDYVLLLKTWREPSVQCDGEEIPRHFLADIFAPGAGVNFHATLNDVPVPIAVIPAISAD